MPRQQLVVSSDAISTDTLKVTKHQFDPRGHSQPVEDLEQVIANDLLMARGWFPRKVAFACYGMTLCLGVVAWLSLRRSIRCFEISSAGAMVVSLFVAIRLGSLRTKDGRQGNSEEVCEVTSSGNSGSSA